MKFMLVGQAPSRMSDPHYPLGGEPLRSVLIRLLGIPEFMYDYDPIRHTDFIRKENALDCWIGKRGKGDAFDLCLGKERGLVIRKDIEEFGYYAVVLGSFASNCLGVENLGWLEVGRVGSGFALKLPHPSGINRWWNDVGNKNRAKKVMGGVGCAMMEEYMKTMRR